MQCSKKILVASWCAAIVLTAAVMVGSVLCIQTDNITALAALAWGELTTAHGFYYWKAKNENRSKHAMKLVNQIANQYGIEAAIHIADTVLKE